MNTFSGKVYVSYYFSGGKKKKKKSQLESAKQPQARLSVAERTVQIGLKWTVRSQAPKTALAKSSRELAGRMAEPLPPYPCRQELAIFQVAVQLGKIQ